jgi:transposase-like protein
MGKKPRRRRSFTPEFKAEIDVNIGRILEPSPTIVDLCQRGDQSAGQVGNQ